MIETQIKLHDKFSFEFKISFINDQKTTSENNQFSINTWLFIPNSLDINRITYPKDQFYKDTKSNLRFITPIFTLKEIYTSENSPIQKLKNVLVALSTQSDNVIDTDDYSYHIKMFASIVKSAIRDKVSYISKESDENKILDHVQNYAIDVRNLATAYRDLQKIIDEVVTLKDEDEYFYFGDEFIGNIIEQQTFELMKVLKRKSAYSQIKEILIGLVQDEVEYKQSKGYALLHRENTTNNYLVT